LAKGEKWTDPQLPIETSAMIGARQNPAELTAWFASLPKLSQPEPYLAALVRGLRLVGARNLRVPGAEQAFARLLSSGSAHRSSAAWSCPATSN
jgi:hypothetical protein